MLHGLIIAEGLIHTVALGIVVQWAPHTEATTRMECNAVQFLRCNVAVLRVRADKIAWVTSFCSVISGMCKVNSCNSRDYVHIQVRNNAKERDFLL